MYGISMPDQAPAFSASRRGVLGVLGAVAAGLALPRAARAAEARPEMVTITPELVKAAQAEGAMSFRYSAQQDLTEYVVGVFKQKYPGITIQLDRRIGTAGTQQFATEERAGRHIVDVHLTTDRIGLKQLAKEGLYQSFVIPDFKQKFPAAAYVEGWGYAPDWNEVLLPFNPDQLPTGQAKKLFATSWNGLLDPSLKGQKIAIVDPESATQAYALTWMFFQLPQYGPGFLKKLAAQNPKFFNGSSAGREALNAGEVSLLLGSVETIEINAFNQGSKLQWVFPNPVPAYAANFHALSAHAPHPHAARLYVAWILSADGAAAMQQAGIHPTFKGVPDNRPEIPKLKQTSWWAPFPEQNKWIPDRDVWDANYKTLLPQIKELLGM